MIGRNSRASLSHASCSTMLDDVTLKVLIHRAEEGEFWAEVPALPGCVSQGETGEEARANVREAIEGWLLAEDCELQLGATDEMLEVTV
jgi:predicted RNase H-like HicB family nuclease